VCRLMRYPTAFIAELANLLNLTTQLPWKES
jgi:hypothetical protein